MQDKVFRRKYNACNKIFVLNIHAFERKEKILIEDF